MFFLLQLLDINGESSPLCSGGVAGHFDMICGSAKAEVKLCGKQQNKWDLARKQQFFGKRLVVATNRRWIKQFSMLIAEANMALDYRILKMSRFRPPMDVGRVRDMFCHKNIKIFDFLFQAKVILGFTASVGLEEMSIELIHQKFMAKLQLVTACEMLIYFDTIGAKIPLKK